MIKRYKWTLLAASLMILCPIIIGIIFWDQLPDMIPTHFGSDNQVNGWTSKPVAVFGMPLFLLAMEFFCAFMVGADPKRKNINHKLMRAILWMIPSVCGDKSDQLCNCTGNECGHRHGCKHTSGNHVCYYGKLYA